MELPPKPDLQYRQRVGSYGEIVVELTPDSERTYAEYLRGLHFAKVAMFKMEMENEGSKTTTQEEAPTTES